MFGGYSRGFSACKTTERFNLLRIKIGKTWLQVVTFLEFADPALSGLCSGCSNCLGCMPSKQEIVSVSANHWNEGRLVLGLTKAYEVQAQAQEKKFPLRAVRLYPCSSATWFHAMAHVSAYSGRWPLADGHAGCATPKLIIDARVWSARHDVDRNHASGQYLHSVQSLGQPKGSCTRMRNVGLNAGTGC